MSWGWFELLEKLGVIYTKALELADLVIRFFIEVLSKAKVLVDETLESRKEVVLSRGGRYTGTVSVTPDPVKFGEQACFTYTTTYPDKVWAEVKVYNMDGTQLLMGGFPRPWAGETCFSAGPTPSWTSGPGKGVLKLIWWDGRRMRDISGAETEFNVTA